MCGICGYVGIQDHALLRSMTTALTHRGPDDEGYYEDGVASLGVRRLSIIDIAGGHQPLTNEDGSICCVFNGEVYNYRELREHLEHAGHDFRTSSDTETIVHAYEEYGLNFPKVLMGMFAIAIWDAARHQLVLARDRIGMKPLYYTEVDGGLTFGSEIKSLLLHPGVHRQPDLSVLRLILDFGYSPDERTSFSGILKLPPANLLLWKDGKRSILPYWELPIPRQFVTDEAAVVRTVRELLGASVRSHLASEVPLGVLLSGGLDSSTIAALSKPWVGDNLRTFTFLYSSSVQSADRRFAREVADYLSANHTELIVDSEDFARLLPEIVYHHDEPKTDPASVPTLAASKEIRKHATVVLVGEGSDEQFGGYASHIYYAHLRLLRGLTPPAWLSQRILLTTRHPRSVEPMVRVLNLVSSLRSETRTLRILNYQVFSDKEFAEDAHEDFRSVTKRANPGDVYGPVLGLIGHRDELAPSFVDLQIYIPNDISMRLDKMMMAASVEARMPFLHVPLLEYSTSIDPGLKTKGGISKYLLRKAMKGNLPEAVLRRKKVGIRVPMVEWIRDNIDDFTNLAEISVAMKRRLFSRDAVTRVCQLARSHGNFYAATHLFAMAVVETWFQMYIDSDDWKTQPPG